MITLSFTTSGACVIAYPASGSADLRVPQQMPVLRIDRDDMRVDGAHEQACRPKSRGPGSPARSTGALAAPGVRVDPRNASGRGIQRQDVVGRCTVYITPSTTSGVASNFSSERAWKIHFCSRFLTFWA